MKQTIKTSLAALAVVLCFAAAVQDAVATISPATSAKGPTPATQ